MAERQLAVVDSTGEIVERRPNFSMTAEKIQLLKDTMCQGATDAEFELAMVVIKRMQLDPFARQIAFIKRWNSDLRREVMTPMVTIDGARLLAERTGKYGGQLGPWWCGADGVWQDIWLKKEPPAAARVGVIRTDWREPLYAVARFDAYAAHKKDGELTSMWNGMADILIAKCAESLALRRAFPTELSGIYSDDEMGQADNPDSPSPRPANVMTAKLSSPQSAPRLVAGKSVPMEDAKVTLWAEAKRRGLTFEMLNLYAQETLGAAPADMTLSAIVQLTQTLKKVTDNDQLLDRLGNRPDEDDAITAQELFADDAYAEATNDPDRFTN